jgi:hypothetical protein
MPRSYPLEQKLAALIILDRTQFMDEMLRLSASPKHDPSMSTLYQRVLVLSRLMDKLVEGESEGRTS